MLSKCLQTRSTNNNEMVTRWYSLVLFEEWALSHRELLEIVPWGSGPGFRVTSVVGGSTENGTSSINKMLRSQECNSAGQSASLEKRKRWRLGLYVHYSLLVEGIIVGRSEWIGPVFMCLWIIVIICSWDVTDMNSFVWCYAANFLIWPETYTDH